MGLTTEGTDCKSAPAGHLFLNMKIFFEYCFYRIATTKYFKKVDSKTPWIWAFGWTSFCELLNIMTIINTYHIFNKSTYNFEFVFILICIPVYFINVFILLTEKKYKRLLEYYKEENNKKNAYPYTYLYSFL